MWLYSINSTNSVCPRGSSLASDNLYEVDSSPEGSSSSSTSDPYRLFAFPESHSPPTPYETTRQREAARRRQAKVKAGKRQLEQNELQTCDEACRITLFENELSENARQRQACWKPAGKSNAFRTKLSQDRLGGNGKLNKSVEKKNEGLKRKAQRVIAKRRVHRIHNVNQASKDKKKVYCEVEQKLLVNQEIRDLSLKRSSSNTACASLKENVRPTLTLGHQPSKAQDEKKLDQVVTSDNAHKLLLDSDGIDRIFDSVVVMPAMYSTKANSYKADGVFRGLSACAIRKSPLLINSTRRYDGINTTAKTKIRDNVSLFKKRTVNELNSGSTDAVISGNCSNFQLQSRALMNYSPELNTEVRIGNTEQYRSEVNGAEPLLLKHAASPRQVTCDSRLKKPQQRRSQTSNNRFPREVWKGAAVRRERFAQLEGKRVKTERTVSITSIKNSNNQLSVLNKPNGRAIDGHSSDEDAKKTGTDECQSGYDQKEMARRRLVDECTQRDCYVVTARYEEPGGHTSFRHAHAATSTKVDTKQATKAVRDQAVKRSGDSGSVKGNLPKKSRTNAEMLGDSPIQILKVISRTGGAVSKNGKASRKNGNSRPKRPEIDKGRSTALANNISPKAQTTFASSKSSSLKATKTDEGPQNFLSNNDRTSAEIAIVSPKKAPKNSTKPNSASPKMAKAGLKREQTVGKTPPKKSIANPANPLIKQSKRDIKNRSPKKSQLPQDNDGRQPSASYTSILDIDLSNLECSIDETEAGISSEARNLMVKSKPVPKNRHTSQSAFVSFPRISIASLFRRSFSRLEEKHSWSEQKRPSILDEKSCRSCFVQLERIKYERVLPLVIPEYPVNFTYLLNSWDIEVVAKIGEGSFSEVFQVRKIEPSGDENTQTEYVIKVVPVGNHGQPKFDDLLPEMHMSLAGRDLQESDVNRAPTFIGLQGMHLVYGEFTDEMASACQIFATNFPDDAEHPLPSERPVDQYFIVFFTSYDGVELETILPKLTTEQKCSIVLQITLGLAAAEAAFDFEHRDLHLSNLVVSDYEINNNDTSNDDDGGCASIATTVSSDNNDHSSMIEFRVEGKSYWVNSFGKKIALIDYGMSRLVVDETLYTSFSSSILEGHNLQRKTYREQHKLVGGIGNYRTAMPETNGLWIKFLICKLFPKRPLNPNKAQYAIQVNQLYEALMLKPVCARNCLSLLAFNGNGGLPT